MRAILSSLLIFAACSAEQPTFVTDGAPPPDGGIPFDSAITPTDLSPSDGTTPPDALPALDIQPIDRPTSDTPPALDDVIVYAHSSSELFAVDPRSLSVRPIGVFEFPEGDAHSHEVTDIAITAGGDIWGVTFDALWRMQLPAGPTGVVRCTLVGGLSLGFGAAFNALSFVPAGILGSAETLIAATRGGDYYLLDTRDGRASRIGQFSGGAGSSGDLVSVQGAGTFATVLIAGREFLVRVDLRTGVTTPLGPTGFNGESGCWGLGYWRSRLYGFTSEGNFVTLDITTGLATVVSNSPRSWWGAGVTTIAPTAPP